MSRFACTTTDDQWQAFAESFTRRYDGRPVSVFRERLERSRRYLVRDRPLHAVIVRDGDASVVVGGTSEKKCEVPIARNLVVVTGSQPQAAAGPLT